jgi:hypothetical protein
MCTTTQHAICNTQHHTHILLKEFDKRWGVAVIGRLEIGDDGLVEAAPEEGLPELAGGGGIVVGGATQEHELEGLLERVERVRQHELDQHLSRHQRQLPLADFFACGSGHRRHVPEGGGEKKTFVLWCFAEDDKKKCRRKPPIGLIIPAPHRWLFWCSLSLRVCSPGPMLV